MYTETWTHVGPDESKYRLPDFYTTDYVGLFLIVKQALFLLICEARDAIG